MRDDEWPPVPDGLANGDELLYTARLEEAKERVKAELARAQAEADADAARVKAISDARLASVADFNGSGR